MKVLVTGAGGFLGGAVARQLRERGAEVRNYSRQEYPKLTELGIDQYVGDLNNSGGCSHAAEGHDVVIHVAAKVGSWGTAESFQRTNVRGTRNIVQACREQGVKSLVFCSTPSVVFDGSDLEGVDESTPYARHFLAEYPRSKAEAEKLVLSANGEELKTVVLRPHLVWGPRDTGLLPRLIERSKAGKLRRLGGPAKKVDVTYVDDAARAHVLAADLLHAGGESAARIAGKVYFISAGEPMPTWDMIDQLLEAAGQPKVAGSVSPGMAYFAGWCMEMSHKLFKKNGEPEMTRWVAKELSTSHWFDISAARRDLGYKPEVSINEGLRRLREWVRNGNR